ncbi:MAG TPA: alpha/beta hydrolase [Opitutaceae bacterium]|nr:alpha/beta hydrolase [Opitutaceae bacterium]
MKARGVAWRILQVLGVFYLMFAMFGCVTADRLIFQPQAPSYSKELPGLKIIPAVDGTSLAVLHLPNASAPHTLFYFHGNAEDLGDVAPLLAAFHASGFAVLAFDYRGYGQSGGRASEKNVYADTQAVLAYARPELGVSPARCVVVGRSVGTGPAVHLAANEPVAGLVLVSPFKSAFRVVTGVRLLPFDRFNNLGQIGRVRCPVLVVHGTADEVIPFEHGEAVFAAASEPKRSVWLEGVHHNDIFQIAGRKIAGEIATFTQGLPAVPRTPQR